MRKRTSLLLLLLLAASLLTFSCRQANTHISTPIEGAQQDARLWTRDIDLPLPLTDRDEQILYRKAYVVSYNKSTLQPNYVAWHLTADHTDGSAPRPQTAWHDDPEVPQPRAYYSDYRGTGWDRGHLCPAGDNKWDETAMYESFLMTNASPQHKAFNSGIWNQIEQSCRLWARRHGDLFIVCGPIFLNQDHDTIGAHRIPVPEAFFKVVACPSANPPMGIGFICRNNEGQRKKDHYVNTIAEVERITGITFFPHLPDSLQHAVKNQADLSRW